MSYIYSDMKEPLTITSSGNVMVVHDEEAIIQSLKNILKTIAGQRVRSPMGSNVIRYLFEPMAKESENDIRDAMMSDIMKHEPRLSDLQIYVRANFDQAFYDIIVIATVSRLRRPIEMRTRLRSMGGV